MSRILIMIGMLFILAGISLPLLKRLQIGQLPGDLLIKKQNFTFYFPITTSIVLSVALSLLFWLLRK